MGFTEKIIGRSPKSPDFGVRVVKSTSGDVDSILEKTAFNGEGFSFIGRTSTLGRK